MPLIPASYSRRCDDDDGADRERPIGSLSEGRSGFPDRSLSGKGISHQESATDTVGKHCGVTEYLSADEAGAHAPRWRSTGVRGVPLL